MKPLFFCLLTTLAATTPAFSQIFADFTLSEGGSPLGSFRVLLHHEEAPRTVANLIGLATGERPWVDPASGAVRVDTPYYDGLIFHRLVHNFVLQGGDPLGSGSGGPGYIFQDEFDPTLRHSGAYVVSMANSGVNSNGSQFFITLAAAPHLDDLHSIFGTVIDDAAYPGSRALIDGFRSSPDFPTDSQDRPLTPIRIESVTFSGPDLAGFAIDDPALGLPRVSGQSVGIRRDPAAGNFLLQWDRRAKWDYPVFSSEDLATWSRRGNILSGNALAGDEIDVTSLIPGERGFLRMAAVDYTHTLDLPADIFANGSSLVLETGGGILTLLFNGNGVGGWAFENANQALSSGLFQYLLPPDSLYPNPPETGRLVSRAGFSFARSLAAREVLIRFDRPVGPDQLNAVQPQLSFHSAGGGWYNGPVNANVPQPARFRGTFTWTPGP